MKLVFICSRYAGDIPRNIERAKELCRMAIEAGHTPFAPHLIYPQILDDSDPESRARGIQAGLWWMVKCDEVWVDMTQGESEGMTLERSHAWLLGKPIVEIGVERTELAMTEDSERG